MREWRMLLWALAMMGQCGGVACGGAPFTLADVGGVDAGDVAELDAGPPATSADGDPLGVGTSRPRDASADAPIRIQVDAGTPDRTDAAAADASAVDVDAGAVDAGPELDASPPPDDAIPWDALPICLPHQLPPGCRGY
ncbi:MAG: hypothetical protein ACHQC8_06565 [Solirubrobacterales bacterium]